MRKYTFTIVSVILIFAGLLCFRQPSPKFTDAYNASCVISRDDGVIGSGVLLDTGYVITNKHVVDEDKDGSITDDETTGLFVRFFEPVASIHSAVIVTNSVTNWRWNLGADFAVLKIVSPDPPKSKIRLQTRKEFDAVKPGRMLFCVGATDGASPPHVTFGPRSSDDDPFYARAGISAYFGNSGGGVFTSDTLELVGLTTRVHIVDNMGYPAVLPDWLMFTPSYDIREFVLRNGNQTVVHSSTERLYWIIAWSLLMGGSFGLTLSFFGYNSCESVRGLFRSDAG